jgi:hypothetical protein
MPNHVVLSTEEIVRGLKHYRRIARQDLLRAPESDDPEAMVRHAEARREVYATLSDIAEQGTAESVVEAALAAYRALPFTSGSDDPAHVELRARENALENFFLMVGLEAKVRREARSSRPSLTARSAEGDGAA